MALAGPPRNHENEPPLRRFSHQCLEGVSVLKNSFALSCAPGSGAEYAVFVVFWACFRALLESRPGRQLLSQHAGTFLVPIPELWKSTLHVAGHATRRP